MKKKMIITAICVVAAFIFLFPFGITKYDDGGTVSYKSMTYEIIRWNRMYGVYDEATGAGTSYWVHDTDFYIFPFNLRDNVADKEWSSEQLKFVKKMSELDNLEQTDAPTTTQVTSMPEETEPIPDCAMPIEPTDYFDAELEFSISPETLTINDSEDGFYIDVTTKIASGRLGYWGSSTVLGADVRVVLHNSGGTTLEEMPLEETKDLTFVTLAEGDRITVRHYFSGKLYPGTYDVYVEWYGQTAVFRDAVVINGIDTTCVYEN